MSKKIRLTVEEKGRIKVLHEQGYRGQKIGNILGKTKSAVNGYLAQKKSQEETENCR